MQLKPGEDVREDSDLLVIHYQHRLPHIVKARTGDVLPACKRCQERVSFRPLNSQDGDPVPHWRHDPDLNEKSNAAAR